MRPRSKRLDETVTKQYFAANLAAPQPYALPRKALYGGPDSFGLLADLAVMDNRLIALDSRSALGVALIDRRDGTISRPTHPGAALDGATEPERHLLCERGGIQQSRMAGRA